MKNIFLFLFVFLFLVIPQNKVKILSVSNSISCKTKQLKFYDNKDSIFLKYIPSDTTKIKYINVNMHFMLKDNNTGNFTENSDGYNDTTYNAYRYAKDLIDNSNYNLANNVKMNLPRPNNTPVLKTKYRYRLKEVLFHKNSKYYYYENTNGSQLIKNFGKDRAKVINIFIQATNAENQKSGGDASMAGYRWVRIKRAWEDYAIGKTGWWVAPILNHEIGHCLGLVHTMRKLNGPCCDSINGYCDDGCSDTPTWEHIVVNLKQASPCCWNDTICSNNMMDYSASQRAITPCQLGKIHYYLSKISDN